MQFLADLQETFLFDDNFEPNLMNKIWWSQITHRLNHLCEVVDSYFKTLNMFKA